MTTKIKNYYWALVFILFIATSTYFSDVLTVDNIKNNKLSIMSWIDGHYSFSVLLFFLSCTVFINSPVPLAAVIKLLSGFFFGFYTGAAYNILATGIACLVGFGISRYALRDIFEKLYYERVKKVDEEIENNGFYYFLTLRLVMVVPYFLINITAGLSRISFRSYFLSTILGVIPSSLIYANGGSQLEQMGSILELFEPKIIASLLLIAASSLIPPYIKKSRQHKTHR